MRAEKIGSRTENSAESVQADIVYDITREHALTRFSWPFATVTRALSLTGNTPEEWEHEYDYPNDCLRLHYILAPEAAKNVVTSVGVSSPRLSYDPVPFEVASGANGSSVVWTDYGDAYIHYTKNITDERLFDPLFIQFFAWMLAAELAIPLGGDSGQKYLDRATRAIAEVMDAARTKSANERERGRQRLPRSIQARRGAAAQDYWYGDLAYRRY